MVAMMTKHAPSLEELDKIERCNQITTLNRLYRNLINIDEKIDKFNEESSLYSAHEYRRKNRNLNDEINDLYKQFLTHHIALNARWSHEDGRFVLPEEVLR